MLSKHTGTLIVNSWSKNSTSAVLPIALSLSHKKAKHIITVQPWHIQSISTPHLLQY